jgi:hypothetical protein
MAQHQGIHPVQWTVGEIAWGQTLAKAILEAPNAKETINIASSAPARIGNHVVLK